MLSKFKLLLISLLAFNLMRNKKKIIHKIVSKKICIA